MGQTTLAGVDVDNLLVTATDSVLFGSFYSTMDSLNLKDLDNSKKYFDMSM